MSSRAATTSLETALKDLPRIGTLVKDRGYRQVWRFEHEGKAYYLKFYPRGHYRDEFRRIFRGSPAMREFLRLQRLQRAEIPSPRAVAVMMGFVLKDKRGDAVIFEAIEPSVQLDQFVNELERAGRPIPNHLELSKQIRELVHKLAKAKLGHSDLHMGNLLMSDGKLFLLDGYAVRNGGLRLKDILLLGHSVSRVATKTDMLRGWKLLTTGRAMPIMNPAGETPRRRFLQGIFKKNRYFGRLTAGEWNGVFFKHQKYPSRWSTVSGITISKQDWETAWPILWQQIQNDQLEVLKRTLSGDVLGGKIELAGGTIEVIIKRPRRRYWYRYLTEIGRGARPRRAWKKSWQMIARHIPTAWPMLMMEKRTLGYVTDTLIVFERVPGKTLYDADLDAMPAKSREMLFRRTGRILRKIEQFGFSHFDAKASNWIVLDDDVLGPTPILIDIDGIRHRRWIALGIGRLLRSLKDQKQYTPGDSLSLCQGYAPYSRIERETPL